MKRIMIMIALAVSACSGSGVTDSGLEPGKFISGQDGKATALYTLRNSAGMEVCITNFGGRIVSVMVPDRDGNFRDVVLGFDNIHDYETVPSDFGAAIGRYANRTNQGRLATDGEHYQLPVHNHGPCIHGGPAV